MDCCLTTLKKKVNELEVIFPQKPDNVGNYFLTCVVDIDGNTTYKWHLI